LQHSDKIMVVAAHPDDEVLGCGGTLAKLACTELWIYVVFVCSGVSSRFEGSCELEKNQEHALNKTSAEVARLIGFDDVVFLRFPDNRLDSVSLLDVVKAIEKLIDRYKPSTIMTHHPGDLNIDHRLTAQAVLTAARPIKGRPVKRIYAFEVPSSTEWNFGGRTGFEPNCFVDISGFLDKKIRAMQMYESEARSFPHPRSAVSLRSLAVWRGSTVGFQAAEAFEVLRDIDPYI